MQAGRQAGTHACTHTHAHTYTCRQAGTSTCTHAHTCTHTQVKIGSKLPFSQVWFISFPFKLHIMIAWNNFYLLAEVIRAKNYWWLKFGPSGPKSGPKLVFLSFFKFGLLIFLDIAQDCSWGQCLTSSRAKKIVAHIAAEMISSILMLLSVHSNLLVFFFLFYVSYEASKMLFFHLLQ